jgi:hypothetical protein
MTVLTAFMTSALDTAFHSLVNAMKLCIYTYFLDIEHYCKQIISFV